jgi:hypothetical protein
LSQAFRILANQQEGKGDRASRSEGSKVGLAHDLQDSKVAPELLSAVEERLPVQVALGKVVRARGVTEFLAKVRMARPNVPRAINPAPQPDEGQTQ